MSKLKKNTINERKRWTFGIAKFFGVFGYKYLAKPTLEIHPEFEPLRINERSVFLYVGLHKSLWETTGISAGLHLNQKNFFIPYIGMGDNLVKGKFFQSLAKKAGIFLIKRPTTRKEMLESARQLKGYILKYISHGVDVMVFPEGTRTSIPTHGTYGQFFPTVFDALLEYEKNKDEILKNNKDLVPYNTYIIPANVDYSKIREDKEMLEVKNKKPRTLHILDSLKMIKNIREAYLSIGQPLKLTDHLEKNRKELAAFARQKCLELVKILPINVISVAILNSIEEGQIKIEKITENIKKVIHQLSQFSDHFRDFNRDDSPEFLIKKVSKHNDIFNPKQINIDKLAYYKLYANYIAHYIRPETEN